MTDRDRAARVLEALKGRPGVLYYLLVWGRRVKVCGPWEVLRDAAVRRDPSGTEVARVGPHSLVPGRFTGTVNGRDAADEPTLLGACRECDSELEAQGWLADPSEPVEVKATRRLAGPWTRNGESWHRTRVGGQVAAVYPTPGRDVTFHGRVRGATLTTPGGDVLLFASAREARDECDRRLSKDGYLLGREGWLSAWEPDDSDGPTVCARYDHEREVVGAVYHDPQGAPNEEEPYRAMADYENVEDGAGEVWWDATARDAAIAADAMLKARGYDLGDGEGP